MKHTVGLSYTAPSGVLQFPSEKTADSSIETEVTVPVSTTNKEVDIAFATANVAALIVSTDSAVTIKVNDTGSPAATISLAANVPIVWPTGHASVGLATTFGTSSITKFYITNGSSSSAAVVRVKVLTDITP